MRLGFTRARTAGLKSGSVAFQLIDSAWYLERYPDVAAAGGQAYEHFMSTGWAEGRWPNFLFDTEWLLTQNPDLENSGMNPLTHYARIGWRENRNPHPLFDTKWYLESNVDVAEAGIHPLAHFLSIGCQQGRSPHPLFCSAWYIKQYPDVVHAGVAPLKHYLGTGWREGRQPSPLFDPKWYLTTYPEVAASGMEPLSHFVAAGAAADHSPHPLFDTAWYTSQNPDVVRAQINPVIHYLTTGWREGRSPNPLFEPRWYLDAYPDVAAAGMDPLMHFIASGGAERRRTGQYFHTDWYVATYPEAAAANINPLQHYLTIGRTKGFHPNALSAAEGAPAKFAPAPKAAQTAAPQPAQAKPAPPAKTPPVIAKNADSVVEPPRDADGNLSYPRFRRGDGRRLAALRLNRDHLWLDNSPLKGFLDALDDRPLLPEGIRRILIIGHDFMQKTGVMRSLSHYLSALTAAGGVEITSLQLAPGADAMVALNDAEVHDLVIVNSLTLFFEHANGIEFMRKCGAGKAAIYLHETDFVFNKLQTRLADKYKAFAAAAPEFYFLTVSGQQEDMLRRKFDARKVYRVHETSPIALPRLATATRSLDTRSPLKVVMAGTLQARKGVDLFSKLADLAAAEGLPWKFRWAGGEVGLSEGLYRSPNVDFVGNLDGAGMIQFMTDADVFLLSSEDDPFPLACLEALQMMKRVVVYRETGTSEIVRSLPGCAVYNDHTPEAAFRALKAAIGSEFNEDACRQVNERFSLRGYADGFARAVSGFYTAQTLLPEWKPELFPRIAAIVHLYHHDLWNDMASHLENLRRWSPDLYVTLTTDKPRTEIDRQRTAILKRWPGATILEMSSPATDAARGAEVIRRLEQKAAKYDFFLNAPSGQNAGPHDATGLLSLRAMLGTPGDVDRIVSLLTDHPELSVIRSTAPAASPQIDLRQAFWGRASEMHALLAGRAPDASMRLGGSLEYDSTLPKPVALLRNKHKEEDIYVIAAGASAGHIDPAFFEGKITIGVNRVFKTFPCRYAVFKEYGNASFERDLISSGAIPVVAQWDSGNIRQAKMRRNSMLFKRPEYYFFEHLENTREIVDASVMAPGSDKLVVSYSTITTAIHLAAYMGARNIILVGHDCGLLDGKTVFEGYYDDVSVSAWDSADEYADWLSQIEDQTLLVRDAVKEQFGARVVSLNPFVNLGLEGHSYSRKPDRISELFADVKKNQGTPALLLCNGPSAKMLNLPANIERYSIARMNFFFLESKPFAGGRVDHLFWSLNEPTFHAELAEIVRSRKYQIAQYNCPVPYNKLTYADGPVSQRPFFDPKQYIDHWTLIGHRPSLAKLLMSRPLPTTGVQALAALAVLGHREIALAGMDFYSDASKRYHYTLPEHIVSKIDPKHTVPGYEKNAHSEKTDLEFLSQVFQEFPNIRLRLLSDMPVLRNFLVACSIPHTVELP